MRRNYAMVHDWIVPDWPAAARVRAVCTTRRGGISVAPYDSMNPAAHVGDDPAAVNENRALLNNALNLPASPVWLQQVHGIDVVNAARVHGTPDADASWTSQDSVVCVVMTADCLPVLLCDRAGRCVAAAHAGWRGLAAGVIEQTVSALPARPDQLLAWLGPAIGPAAYVVGSEVRDTFLAHAAQAADAFTAAAGGWHADLYRLARQRLARLGVTAVYGGEFCSFSERDRFYSYRRDGATGRMASLIWLAGE